MVYLFRLYIKASLHLALSACALVAVTARIWAFECSATLYGFIFCTMVLCYNSMKYLKTKPPKDILLLTLFALVGACYGAFQLSWEVRLISACLLALCLLYALPVPPFRYALRQYGVAKMVVVALCWGGHTVITPMVYALGGQASFRQLFLVDKGTFLLARILLIMALLIPFEISDMHGDNTQWKTLPQRIGLRRTTYCGYALLVLYGAFSTFDIAHTITILLTALSIQQSHPKRTFYYARFWVESIPLVLLVLVYVCGK